MASNPQQQSSSMSSPPSPLVWFQRLDSATGLPYKKTSASIASVSFSADVDDFRKAVYLENSPILTGITSSQLTVYKNKAAFDKRNAADDGKEKPLDPTESLGLLGSKEDMLVIVVPSSIHSESSSLDVVSGLPGNEVI